MSVGAPRRTVLLVIDGLGLGTSPSAQASEPNTFRSIAPLLHDVAETSRIFGVGDSSHLSDGAPVRALRTRHHRIEPGYPGADTLLGHVSICGGSVDFQRVFLPDSLQVVVDALRGFQLQVMSPFVLVEDAVIVTANMESDPGLNLNVVAMNGPEEFDMALKVAGALRQQVGCMRVLAIAGRIIDLSDVTTAAIVTLPCPETPSGFVAGLSMKGLEIYSDNYTVTHLTNLSMHGDFLLDRFTRAELPVALIGKVADLFGDASFSELPGVDTTKVLSDLHQILSSQQGGLVFANIQGVDIAGHGQDARAAARCLDLLTEYWAGDFLNVVADDLVVVTADHGNEPESGDARHTVEMLPLTVLNHEPSDVTPLRLSDVTRLVRTWHGWTPISKRGTT